MKVAMEELLYKAGVDLVFNGHVSTSTQIHSTPSTYISLYEHEGLIPWTAFLNKYIYMKPLNK